MKRFKIGDEERLEGGPPPGRQLPRTPPAAERALARQRGELTPAREQAELLEPLRRPRDRRRVQFEGGNSGSEDEDFPPANQQANQLLLAREHDAQVLFDDENRDDREEDDQEEEEEDGNELGVVDLGVLNDPAMAHQLAAVLAQMQAQMQANNDALAAAAAAFANPQPPQAQAPPAPAAAAGPRPPTLKVRFFESDNPLEWDTWLQNFTTAAELGGWDNREARQMLAGSLGGKARELVNHIPTAAGPIGPVQPWQELATAYGAAFRPQAASDMAKRELADAMQESEEKIANWHSRVRKLFTIAEPNENPENSPRLFEAYLRGLWEDEVREELLTPQYAYQTYTELLAQSHNVQAKGRKNAELQKWKSFKLHEVSAIASKKKTKAAAEESKIAEISVQEMSEAGNHQPQVDAINPSTSANTSGGTDNRKCFICEGPHLKRNCPSFPHLKVITGYNKRMEQRKKTANFGKAGTGNKNRGKGINSLEAVDEDDDDNQGNGQGREEMEEEK